MIRPRPMGVEPIGLWVMAQVGFLGLLERLGLTGPRRAAAVGSIIGRMAAQRQTIEGHLFNALADLFSLSCTVTLYDLTHPSFEGEAAEQPKAKRGVSKEKRSDCPWLTLGWVLDGSGFVRGLGAWKFSTATYESPRRAKGGWRGSMPRRRR